MQKNEVMIAGHRLWEFCAKMTYPVFTSSIEQEVFQGVERSSIQPLYVRASGKHMECTIDYYGERNAERTANQSALEALMISKDPIEIDIGDGFFYRASLVTIGRCVTTSELVTSVVYTFRVTRHTQEISAEISAEQWTVQCQSNVPKTDCRIVLPISRFAEAENILVTINDQQYGFEYALTGDLVLDGINKVFTMGGVNVTDIFIWTDFPYLVPGENTINISVEGVSAQNGGWISYTPTYQ